MKMFNKIKEFLQLDDTCSRIRVLAGREKDNNLRTILWTLKKSIPHLILYIICGVASFSFFKMFRISEILYFGGCLMSIISFHFGLKYFSAERYFQAIQIISKISSDEKININSISAIREKDKIADRVNIILSAIMLLGSMIYGYYSL